MRRITPFQTVAVLSLFLLTACQKEISWDGVSPVNVENKLIGEWKFLFLSVSSEVAEELSDGQDVIKSISKTAYSSTNNKGTVKIDARTMSGVNVSYDVSAIVKADFYENDVFLQTLEQPFDFSVPASSSSSDYTLVNADSLYFPGGGFVSASPTPGAPSQPVGYRYKIEGNRLTLSTVINKTEQQTSSGITQKTVTKGTGLITLEK